MIRLGLKQCCCDCASLDLDTHAEILYGGTPNPVAAEVTIVCKHRRVCKAYVESENTYDTISLRYLFQKAFPPGWSKGENENESN